MKNYLNLIVVLFFFSSNAQQFDCNQGTKDYLTLFKANKIDESYIVWSAVRRNCEKEQFVIYEDGLNIIQAKIEHTKSLEERERLIRDGLKLYEECHTYFPTKSEDYEVGKAMLMYYNSVRAKQQMDEIFSLLENGFSKASDKIKNSNAINLYFELYYFKFKAKEITAETITKKYFLVSTMLNRLQMEYPKNLKAYKLVKTKIDSRAKAILSCNGVNSFYEKAFNANKENSKWLIEALDLLSIKCATSPIFYKCATTLFQIYEDVQSASYMGLALLKQKKYPEAVQYYEKAASMEDNPAKKAAIYFNLATKLAAIDKIMAKEYFNKSLQVDEKMAKSYLSLAQLYATSIKDCGVTDFDKKALYYLIVVTANKASEIDSKLKPQCSKFIDKYVKEALTEKEIRKAKLSGKSYEISCWIKETIKFP